MPLNVWVFLALLFIICRAEKKIVPLNEDSSFFPNIASIVIDTDHRMVIIDLQQKRQCDSPTFAVRLSGTALYLLKLDHQDYQPLKREGERLLLPRKHTYYFSYPPIQDSGLYFLEVLGILCGTFHPSHLMGNCVADFWRGKNVVTAANSIMLNATTTTSSAKAPRWLLTDHTKLAALPTRVQHRTCPDVPGNNLLCEYRRDPGEVWQYQLYNFTDSVDWNSTYQRIGAPAAKVCFVGASHSRELTYFANQMDRTGTQVEFAHVDSHFPEDFSLEMVASYKCDYAVVGYGQWPLSWVPEVPYNDERFRSAMKAVLSKLSQASTNGATMYFVRSINYNGLASSMTQCPPADHRIPPVIDAMNKILWELAAVVSVPYIDLNHIMGPMWDSALDYCHPGKAVFTAEVEWILNTMFTPMAAAAPKLVRFTDSTAVYLVQGGVARAFPNGATFMKMGFDFGDVATLHVLKRADYSFGEDLPAL